MPDSFQLKIPESVTVPEGIIPINVIAKTTLPTFHPEDPKHPHREFELEELELAARSLFGRTISVNHKELIGNAIVLNSGWNSKMKYVEAILGLPMKFVELIKKKEITHVSVDYIWDSIKKIGEKSIFKGLKFVGIALAHGEKAGDDKAKILTETQKGQVLMEIVPVMSEEETAFYTSLGEPFAGYDNHADCVAQNQDKRNPDAFCAWLKARAEVKINSEIELIEHKLEEIQRGREENNGNQKES